MRKQTKEPAYSNQAKRHLRQLDASFKKRFEEGILNLPDGDVRPYRSKPGYLRLRVGNVRVIFRWINDEQIAVDYLDNRGDIY